MTGAAGRCRGRDRDPRRRSACGENAQRPPRHRRRLVDPRHDRRRRALFLLGLDPFDPSRHRCRPRDRSYPHRRRDRRDLRSRRAEAARSARDGADRHGRLRRRHAQICPRASGAARHHRRRRRQDDQARAGAARPAFQAWRGRSRRARELSAESAGASDALRARILAANTAAEAFAHAQGEGIALGDAVARAAQQAALRVLAGRDVAIEIVLFDRDGGLAGRAPFFSAHDAPPRNLRR